MPQRVLFLGKALVVLKMRGMLWQNQKGKVGMQNPTLSTLERISQGLGISMDDLFKDIDTPINVENAAIRHLSQVISELSPEQTQQLLQIVDSVMAIKNEYL